MGQQISATTTRDAEVDLEVFQTQNEEAAPAPPPSSTPSPQQLAKATAKHYADVLSELKKLESTESLSLPLQEFIAIFLQPEIHENKFESLFNSFSTLFNIKPGFSVTISSVKVVPVISNWEEDTVKVFVEVEAPQPPNIVQFALQSGEYSFSLQFESFSFFYCFRHRNATRSYMSSYQLSAAGEISVFSRSKKLLGSSKCRIAGHTLTLYSPVEDSTSSVAKTILRKAINESVFMPRVLVLFASYAENLFSQSATIQFQSLINRLRYSPDNKAWYSNTKLLFEPGCALEIPISKEVRYPLTSIDVDGWTITMRGHNDLLELPEVSLTLSDQYSVTKQQLCCTTETYIGLLDACRQYQQLSVEETFKLPTLNFQKNQAKHDPLLVSFVGFLKQVRVKPEIFVTCHSGAYRDTHYEMWLRMKHPYSFLTVTDNWLQRLAWREPFSICLHGINGVLIRLTNKVHYSYRSQVNSKDIFAKMELISPETQLVMKLDKFLRSELYWLIPSTLSQHKLVHLANYVIMKYKASLQANPNVLTISLDLNSLNEQQTAELIVQLDAPASAHISLKADGEVIDISFVVVDDQHFYEKRKLFRIAEDKSLTDISIIV